jgi:hypothetical protein
VGNARSTSLLTDLSYGYSRDVVFRMDALITAYAARARLAPQVVCLILSNVVISVLFSCLRPDVCSYPLSSSPEPKHTRATLCRVQEAGRINSRLRTSS